MHNELTKKDIELMEQELVHRLTVLQPQLLEEVKTARAFGDLSENFEYKAAKQAKNKNDSRIRYLQNMIRTARIVDESPKGDGAGLYDRITVTMPGGKKATYQVVTTVRSDPLHGLISRESPVGKALLGRKPGDKVHIQIDETTGYDMVIEAVEKGQDGKDIPLNSY